ncbi:MAG: IS5 family transposase [Candidatus Omnitrophota bacterium]
MLEKRDTRQQSMFGSYVYDKVVSKEHLLRRISQTLDFSFVNKACADLYCLDNGRPGWSPILMFKVIFLQFLYDLSDYRIEEELNDRLSFKMFIGLDLEEAPPDHSSISRFRDRLGAERFKELFNHIVKLARDKGIISDKLHIIDATVVRAKVDLYRIKEEYSKTEPDTYIDNHSPDKEARPGRTFKGRQFYGFKAHCLLDAESEIIVNTETTGGNVKESTQLPPLSASVNHPQAITADKAYDCQENHSFVSKNRVRNGIMVKSNHTKEYLEKHLRRVSNIAKRYRNIIEHKFAECKKHHGLRIARYWGLAKMRIQTYMTAICVNVKRMIRLLYRCASPPKIYLRQVKT